MMFISIFIGAFVLYNTNAFSGPHSLSRISPNKYPASFFSTHVVLKSSSSSSSQPQNQAPNQESDITSKLFPVLSQISGVEWNGACRYVSADLRPVTKLKLVGGVRYDLDDKNCTLSSFLTFPNGQTREVVMRGTKDESDNSHSLRLDSTAPDGGPIYMLLTEVLPDTVLINEVEKSSEKIIMTSSLSIVNGGNELVQVSHEVGDEGNKISMEGHQIWRLKQVPIEYDDFAARDTTGR